MLRPQCDSWNSFTLRLERKSRVKDLEPTQTTACVLSFLWHVWGLSISRVLSEGELVGRESLLLGRLRSSLALFRTEGELLPRKKFFFFCREESGASGSGEAGKQDISIGRPHRRSLSPPSTTFFYALSLISRLMLTHAPASLDRQRE